MNWKLRTSLRGLLTTGLAIALSPLSLAQQPPASNLTEPVYRVSKNEAVRAPNVAPHPLDPALDLARDGLTRVRQGVNDYTAILIKRERIGEELGEYEFMFAKVRNRKVENNQIVVPFSVYLSFLKPQAVKGREVLYVEDENEGKMIAHEGGMKRMLGTHYLAPNSWLAMQGQRYPITDIGVENLLIKLIERGERDKSHGDCHVTFTPDAKVSGRPCTVLKVTHPQQAAHFDFHIAEVFIDNELQIPLRYAAYGWPRKDSKPEVLEEYTYQDLKLNVGLTDDDFNVKNPAYGFQKK